MVSAESVKLDLAEAQSRILILMQEGDEGGNSLANFPNVEWANEMFDAYEHIKKAIQSMNRAELYE